MLEEKRVLDVEELEAQTALELPERELMATVNQVGLVNVGVAVDNLCVQALTVDSSQSCSSGGSGG
jgi:hypothetical protein